MSKKPIQRKSSQKMPKLPPIVVVPDKSYIDDTGNVIPTDVILVADETVYLEMQKALRIFAEKPISVSSQRGNIEG